MPNVYQNLIGSTGDTGLDQQTAFARGIVRLAQTEQRTRKRGEAVQEQLKWAKEQYMAKFAKQQADIEKVQAEKDKIQQDMEIQQADFVKKQQSEKQVRELVPQYVQALNAYQEAKAGTFRKRVGAILKKVREAPEGTITDEKAAELIAGYEPKYERELVYQQVSPKAEAREKLINTMAQLYAVNPDIAKNITAITESVTGAKTGMDVIQQDLAEARARTAKLVAETEKIRSETYETETVDSIKEINTISDQSQKIYRDIADLETPEELTLMRDNAIQSLEEQISSKYNYLKNKYGGGKADKLMQAALDPSKQIDASVFDLAPEEKKLVEGIKILYGQKAGVRADWATGMNKINDHMQVNRVLAGEAYKQGLRGTEAANMAANAQNTLYNVLGNMHKEAKANLGKVPTSPEVIKEMYKETLKDAIRSGKISPDLQPYAAKMWKMAMDDEIRGVDLDVFNLKGK